MKNQGLGYSQRAFKGLLEDVIPQRDLNRPWDQLYECCPKGPVAYVEGTPLEDFGIPPTDQWSGGEVQPDIERNAMEICREEPPAMGPVVGSPAIHSEGSPTSIHRVFTV